MTRVSINVTVGVQVHLILNEDEALALDALAGYGIDPFLEVFYKSLGRAYLQPHEKGLRSLFAGIRECVPSRFNDAQECREFLALENGETKARKR